MEYSVICDTGIISRYLAGNKKIVTKINNKIGLDKICITPIIRIEALNWVSGYVGLDKFDRSAYLKFIKAIPLHHITLPISQLSMTLSDKDINSRPGDTLIAANAIHHKLQVYTLNTRHYRIMGVDIVR